ncbi:hypothetical protein V5O48_007210 [Marasmius crinis-equi]|uniref:F-box domain-containing protein n=1 Tax=Marasmius crinis-equi TaxID=585013 RepID=A0ABR3FHW2_9AGAR
MLPEESELKNQTSQNLISRDRQPKKDPYIPETSEQENATTSGGTIDRLKGTGVLSRFPVEIWEKIFRDTCALVPFGLQIRVFFEEETWPGVPLLGVRCLPLTISHVSSLWRVIVRNLPSLWSSIAVELQFPNHDLEIARHLKIFLSNSREHYPLIIRLSLRGGGHSESLQVLAANFPRCRELIIEACSGDAIHSAISHSDLDPSSVFPKLQLVTICDDPAPMPDEKTGRLFWAALSAAPRLTGVRLFLKNSDFSASDLTGPNHLPSQQITSLELELAQLDASDLRHFPSLRELSVHVDRDNGILESSLEPATVIELSSLVSLAISGHSFFAIKGLLALFSTLHLPILRKLEVNAYHCVAWPEHVKLGSADFLDLDGRLSSLTKLLWNFYATTPSEEADIVACFPWILQYAKNLTELHVEKYGIDPIPDAGSGHAAGDAFAVRLFDLFSSSPKRSDPETGLPKLKGLYIWDATLARPDEVLASSVRNLLLSRARFLDFEELTFNWCSADHFAGAQVCCMEVASVLDMSIWPGPRWSIGHELEREAPDLGWMMDISD